LAKADPATLNVVVAPALSYLVPGQALQLSAVVSGATNQTVTWTATIGSVTPGSNNTMTYTAPTTLGTCTITATIGSVTATATVVISPYPPAITPTSTITTFAGTGVQGHAGNGGLATNAQLWGAGSLALGPDGSAYISEASPGAVRRVFPNGTIATVAGNGTQGCGPDGVPANTAALTWVHADVVAPDGTIYIVDYGCGTLRTVSPSGIINTVPGIFGAGSLARAADGSIYMTFNGANQVKRLSPNGTLSLIAGTGAGSSTGDNGPALLASLHDPHSLAVGPDGSLYISENTGNRVRRVDPNGIITTIAGTGASGYSGDGGPGNAARLAVPYAITVGPDGALYLSDTGNHVVRRVGMDGIIGTVVGTGTLGYSGDGGPCGQAQLSVPDGLVFAADGALLVSDLYNFRVRRIK
jgi:serine/threonine-protein kinase